MKLEYTDGATPLDPDEAAGLKLTHIATMEELNIFEQQNIQQAAAWAFGGREKDMLNQTYIRQLHKRMFGNVWKWAGEYRTSNKNIGVAREMIGIELRQLCDDVAYWIAQATFSPDKIAVRFHHRLVAIHPFSNGNGRHARLIADVLLERKLICPRFSWGGDNLVAPGDIRPAYIHALQAADRGDYSPLMQFIRS